MPKDAIPEIAAIVCGLRRAVEVEFGLPMGSLGSRKKPIRRQWSTVLWRNHPEMSEKFDDRMGLGFSMLCLVLRTSLADSQREVAKRLGVSDTLVSKGVNEALGLLSADENFRKRYHGVRDRVRSHYWYVSAVEGRALVAQTWALKMRGALEALSLRGDMPPDARDLVADALRPPWEAAEMLPDLDPAAPGFVGQAPPEKYDPPEPPVIDAKLPDTKCTSTE